MVTREAAGGLGIAVGLVALLTTGFWVADKYKKWKMASIRWAADILRTCCYFDQLCSKA
jgi:hypothetical protein